MATGWRRVRPEAEIDLAPMADGGEGTVEALVAATGGTFREADVTGPLGEPVRAPVRDARRRPDRGRRDGGGLGPDAARSARPARPAGGPRPGGPASCSWRPSTPGRAGVILGIGGSATNDGGAGLGQALGFRLLDAEGHDLPPGGGALGRPRPDRPDRARPAARGGRGGRRLRRGQPALRPRGASAVYGPQKGATPEDVVELDRNLDHLRPDRRARPRGRSATSPARARPAAWGSA